MPETLATIEKSLPLLLVIFVGVFFSITLIRLVFNFMLNQAYKRYLSMKRLSKKVFQGKKDSLPKEDEELFRVKNEIPRAHSAVKAEMMAKKSQENESGSYELMVSDQHERDKQELGKVEIVDIVKPIGFWTSMILGQKLTYLIQSAKVLNQRGNKGFWVSMIEAKEREAGRQHSRGR